MEQIVNGNRKAFAGFLNHYLPAVVGFARRYVGNADADDVAQEAFLRVWTRAGMWDAEKGSLRAWLYRITYNLCMDMKRKKQPVADAGGLDELTEQSPDPEMQLQNGQQQQQLQKVLLQLPERQQLALNLCAYQGLSNKDAAMVMDISVEALESLLSRARRQLKTQFLQLQAGDDHG